ncbi:hypothetical protein BC835DRAFT_1307474 [Cytidiella melzeri]|nr:hypothetical protein BC835DRAFT_1307474 [Cytidiella melzeri]
MPASMDTTTLPCGGDVNGRSGAENKPEGPSTQIRSNQAQGFFAVGMQQPLEKAVGCQFNGGELCWCGVSGGGEGGCGVAEMPLHNQLAAHIGQSSGRVTEEQWGNCLTGEATGGLTREQHDMARLSNQFKQTWAWAQLLQQLVCIDVFSVIKPIRTKDFGFSIATTCVVAVCTV